MVSQGDINGDKSLLFRVAADATMAPLARIFIGSGFLDPSQQRAFCTASVCVHGRGAPVLAAVSACKKGRQRRPFSVAWQTFHAERAAQTGTFYKRFPLGRARVLLSCAAGL